jgi:protein SHQ1
MPLTPRFELSQTESEVIVVIAVPTVRVTNIEVFLEESTSTFHFHATPYLLKLHFLPYQFAEDSHGEVPAEYDPSSQKITVRLIKALPYKQWPNLDLTARLLQPKEIPSRWLHSVQSDSHEPNEEQETLCESEDSVQPELHQTDSDGYGFGGIFKNIFTDYCRGGLAQEMLQLPEPESTSSASRRVLRLEKESADFDRDRYVQDLYIQEDYLYPMVMELEPFWSRNKGNGSKRQGEECQPDDANLATRLDDMHLGKVNVTSRSSPITFTSDETLQLATIPYPLLPARLLDFHEDSTVWLGLLDLLVPFVYDHLTTMAEPTVESAWTITTLSSSLSWLDPPSNIQETVRCLTRRTLIYPYWRNFQFSLYVWEHTLSILESGVHAVVRSLLMIRNILEKSESYYVGNKLFVDPFLYWIQQTDVASIPKGFINALKGELSFPNRLKSGLGLSVDTIEQEHGMDEDENSINNQCDDEESSASSLASDDTSSDESSAVQDTSSGTSDVKAIDKVDTPELLDSIIGDKTSPFFIGLDTRENVDSEKKDVAIQVESGSKRTGRPLIEEFQP